MPRIPKIALPVLLMTSLSACAPLSSLLGEPDRNIFELMPAADTPMHCRARPVGDLVIEEPKSRSVLDTDRIMIRPSALQAEYLPGARWGDTVPVTLQTLLIRDFSRYDAFRHVGRAPVGTMSDYTVISEINDFNAEASGGGAVVRLSVNASVIREADARVVAQGRFTRADTSPTTRTEDIVEAFDRASHGLVAEMTAWGLAAMQINTQNCRPR